MREQAAFAGPGGAEVTILDAGRATFEIANPAQRKFIDEVEVGRAVAPRIRLAFEVDDVAGVTGALVAAGATELAGPRPTPFGSVNARLEAPAELQITLFERDKPAPAATASGDLVIRDAQPADWAEIWPFFRQIVAAGDTYTWPRDMSEDDARAAWFPSPGRTVVASVAAPWSAPPTQPNHAGPGAHVANAGFMVDPGVRRARHRPGPRRARAGPGPRGRLPGHAVQRGRGQQRRRRTAVEPARLHRRRRGPGGVRPPDARPGPHPDHAPAVVTVEDAFVVFDQQDSGCLSYGVERAGRRCVRQDRGRAARAGPMTRVVALHRAVRHPAIVRPVAVLPGPTLVYPWCPGRALNAATVHGGNRSALERFRRLPADEIRRALDAILDAHVAIAAAGWVSVDLYDGCFLYDFDSGLMYLIDLDEYRPGAFVLDADRLPGSRGTWRRRSGYAARPSTSGRACTSSAGRCSSSCSPTAARIGSGRSPPGPPIPIPTAGTRRWPHWPPTGGRDRQPAA